jgi:hypothetical protein
VHILHAMFVAEADVLPVGFASRLKSVIANQYALNPFYDLVRRHEEAVNAGNWTQPFPIDAAKRFFEVVEEVTVRRRPQGPALAAEISAPRAAAFPDGS